jgi:vacuolar-type H+-ATPase subunit I/STV1
VIVRLKTSGRTMAETQGGATLAHLTDTVTAIAEQLGEQKEAQQTILAVLSQLLETNQAQSEMLSDILGAASQDVGPSPVAQALEALAEQVQQMDENQSSLIERMAELPEAIGRQFETGLKDFSAMAAASH